MVVFQPSLVDSPAPADDEGSKQDACVRNRTRSRSRQSSGLSTGETRDMLQGMDRMHIFLSGITVLWQSDSVKFYSTCLRAF